MAVVATGIIRVDLDNINAQTRCHPVPGRLEVLGRWLGFGQTDVHVRVASDGGEREGNNGVGASVSEDEVVIVGREHRVMGRDAFLQDPEEKQVA